jgi:hypothetical protein
VGLQPFEKKPVIRAEVKITKAGDGLSDALKVDPIELHVNDRVFFVLEAEVDAVQFKRMTAGGSDMTRVHVLATQRITQVDGADVKAYLDDAEQHLRRALAEISDDQQTLDDEAARQAEEQAKAAEAASTNGHGEPEPGSVADTVAKVKKARAKRPAPAAATPTGDA